jgi:hypothetical protein
MNRCSNIVGWLLLTLLAESLAAQQCSNVSDVDFRNSVVQLKPTQDWPLSRLRFRYGVFDEQEESKGTSVIDWRYEIEKETIVNPAPQTTIRFLEILRDHMSGTGSFTCLVGFSCSQGKMKNVFQQCGEFMKVVSLTPQNRQLEFETPKWSDPPSIKTKRSFTWNSTSGSYVQRPN